MKIIRPSLPDVPAVKPTEFELKELITAPVPGPAFVASAPALPDQPEVDVDQMLNKALDQFKQHILADLNQLLEKYEKARAQGDVQLQQNSRGIEKLAEEVSALRTVVEFQRVKEKGTPAAAPLPLGELNQLLEKYEKARAQGDVQLQQNARGIEKLTEEVSALRKTVVEFQRPKEKEPPVTAPAPAPVPVSIPVVPTPLLLSFPKPAAPEPVREPVRSPILDAMLPVKPPPAAEKTERKVAILTRLWDYLNQAAFETPPNKQDRPK